MPLDELIADKIPIVSRESALKISRTTLFNTLGFVGGTVVGVAVGSVLQNIFRDEFNSSAKYTREQQAIYSLVLLASWALPAKLHSKIPTRVLLDFAPGYAVGAYFGTGLSNYLTN